MARFLPSSRWARTSIVLLLIVVVPLAVLLLAFRFVPAFREALLAETLSRAEGALPGEWSTGRLLWSEPGRVEIRDFVWTRGPDTLAAAERLLVEVELGPLLKRRVHVRELELTGAQADVPALQRAFPGGEADSTEEEAAGDGGGWPVRSIACDSLTVDVVRLRLDEVSEAATGRLAGRFEVGADRSPHVDLREVSATLPPWNLDVGPGSLTADPRIPRGEGRLPIRWKDGATVEVRATVDESRHLVLAVDAAEAFGTNANVSLRVGPEAGNRRRPVDLEASLVVGTPDRLSEGTPLPPALSELPAGSRVDLNATGELTLPPDPSFTLDLRVTSTLAAVDSAAARVAWSAAGTDVQDLRWNGRGLSATGRARLGAGALDVNLETRLTSLDAMRPFAEPPAAVSPLDVTARVTATGSRATPQAVVSLTGSFGEGRARVDSLDLRVTGDAVGDGSVAFDLAALSSGVWLLASGERISADPLTIETGPWRVATARAVAPAGPRGRIELRDGAVRIRGLRVDGELGDLQLEGTWSEDGGGDVSLDASWPKPPPAALVPAESRDRLLALAARWDQGGAPSLTARGRISKEMAWTADLQFLLPGPLRLLPDAPAELDLSGTESVRGTLHASGDARRWNADLDLSDTPWLDEAIVRAHAVGDSVAVDSLRLAAFGVQVSGSAALADSLDGKVELDTESLDRLRERVGSLPEDLTLALAATATLAGLREAPALHVEAAARGAGPDWRADGVKLDASIRGATLESLELTAVDSLVVRGFAVEVAAVEVRPFRSPSAPDSTALLASVHVESELFGVTLVAGATQDDGWRVAADTLAVRWHDADLRARAPFVAHYRPQPRTVTVDGLDLEGTMGTLRADGRVDAEDAAFRLEMDLISPLRDDDPRPWPDRIAGTIEAVRRDSVTLDLQATGFPPGERPTATDLKAEIGPAGATASVVVSVEDDQPVRADLRAPVVVDLVSAHADTVPGDWSAELDLDRVTVPLRFETAGPTAWIAPDEENRIAFVSGRATLAGPPGSPTGSFEGKVAFPEGSNLRDRTVDLQARLESPGLHGSLRWRDADTSTAEVDAHFPQFHLDESFRPQLGSTMDVRVREDDFPLSDLDPFLSPGTHLEGRLGCDVHVSGSPEDAALEGWLEARKVVASDSRGNRALGEGRIEFGGTLAAPKANGRLELTQGRLNIPEPSRTLHDARGSAMLWPEPPPDQAPPDSTVAAPIESLDLGIDVSIPGSLILRGRGLDLNLSGELSLVIVDGAPRVEGDLQATSGSLAFLGTRFEVDSGRAVFYGGDTIDPNLDLVMSRQKGDVRAIVHITGRSSAPRLELSSEPPMEEADILSQVLFGRGSSDLDGAETGFLQSQTAAALRMFAMPEVERELGARLGLDVVQLDAQGPESNELSLTVGKYLSPRALLQVDQGLERVGDSALRLEYWLTRHLKLETITSRQSHSGLELNWTKDY